MNSLKRKVLATAVFAGLGVAGSAQAVYQDPHGLGQVLIYPYYTVQAADGNAYNTYISVVNTTADGKVVKVRFREGKNSREVLDFNLYLSPNDVWTAAVIPASATLGEDVPGRIITADASCTNPAIPAGGVNFRNLAYAGANDDGGGETLDRTREGYVEMIEMATITNGLGVDPDSLTAITHVSGVPDDCAAVRGPALSGVPGFTEDLAPPSGGLSGTGTLINVQNGSDAGYNAVALANFRAAAFYTDVGNEAGNLNQADPVSVVVSADTTGTRVYTADWTTSALAGFAVDAVSATMMHTNVINEFVLDAATKSNTDWVVTFPTKRYYADIPAPGPAFTPFTEIFGGDCEPIEFTYFDREEAGAAAADGDFSPSPGPSGASLCYEANVVSIRSGQGHNPSGDASGVLGSLNTTGINITDDLQNGWANLRFIGTNAVAGVGTGLNAPASIANLAYNANSGLNANGAAQQYLGLPVTGFMVRSFNNGTLTCAGASCQGNYGSAFTHNYEDSILPAP